MTRKILQIGSSVGITIPKSALKELNMSVGDEVVFTVDSARKRASFELPTKVDGELVSWTRDFIEKYRPALDSLKDK